jgi:hypothetical protein
MSEISNDKLIKFLRDTANSFEQKNLNETEIFSIGELYTSMKFFKHNSYINKEKQDEKDLIKFLSLGWYIYNIIDENKNESN